MQIVVLTGSAHLKGMSALLAEKFIDGATEAGHHVVRIDTAYKKVQHCLGCLKCNGGDKVCVLDDDMTAIGQTIEKIRCCGFRISYILPSYANDTESSLGSFLFL